MSIVTRPQEGAPLSATIHILRAVRLQKLPQTHWRHGNRVATTKSNMSDAFRCLERLKPE
jgi:hypothetical protein